MATDPPDAPRVAGRGGRDFNEGHDSRRRLDLVETGAITDRGDVEHICVGGHLRPVGDVLAWDLPHRGIYLSDHPTLAIDLTIDAGTDTRSTDEY